MSWEPNASTSDEVSVSAAYFKMAPWVISLRPNSEALIFYFSRVTAAGTRYCEEKAIINLKATNWSGAILQTALPRYNCRGAHIVNSRHGRLAHLLSITIIASDILSTFFEEMLPLRINFWHDGTLADFLTPLALTIWKFNVVSSGCQPRIAKRLSEIRQNCGQSQTEASSYTFTFLAGDLNFAVFIYKSSSGQTTIRVQQDLIKPTFTHTAAFRTIMVYTSWLQTPHRRVKHCPKTRHLLAIKQEF